MSDIQSRIESVVTAANRLSDIDVALVVSDERTVESILTDLSILETAVGVLVAKTEQKLARHVGENYDAGVWIVKFPELHRRVMNRVRVGGGK
jgi:hypothetical protein